MVRTAKFFWLDADDNVHPMTLARHERIFHNKVAAPEFAGQVLRLITVIVEVEERRVTQITGLHGALISFDTTGRPDETSTGQAVVDALSPGDAGRAAAIRFRYEYTFEVTGAQLAAIKRHLQRRR